MTGIETQNSNMRFFQLPNGELNGYEIIWRFYRQRDPS